MKHGRLVFELEGTRFIALDKDRRNTYKCYGCSFSFRPEWCRKCPIDKDGNKLCEFGHGFIFKTLPPPQTRESGDALKQLTIPEVL